MIEVPYIVTAAAYGAGAYLFAEVVERFVWPCVPAPISERVTSAREAYFNVWRRFTPDYFYRLWYRTGVMTEEVYRQYQERGFIKSDLDPEYIQRTNSE